MHHYEGTLSFSITAVSPDRVVASMPIAPGMLNPFGTVHAGALIWFADVTATTLALDGREITAGMSGFPLAINLNANLVGNQREGTLTATAEYVKRGRSVSVINTKVSGREGRLLIDVTTNHVPSR